MAEERPFAKNCAEKNMELLERSEVSQGEIDYYMELYIYMELELYCWKYIDVLNPCQLIH